MSLRAQASARFPASVACSPLVTLSLALCAEILRSRWSFRGSRAIFGRSLIGQHHHPDNGQNSEHLLGPPIS